MIAKGPFPRADLRCSVCETPSTSSDTAQLDLNLGVMWAQEKSRRTKWSGEQVPLREGNQVVRQEEKQKGSRQQGRVWRLRPAGEKPLVVVGAEGGGSLVYLPGQ